MSLPDSWITRTPQGDVYKRDYRSAPIFWWLFTLGVVVASVWMSLTSEWWKGLFLLVVSAPVAVLLLRVVVVPRLIVTSEGVEVWNPFRRAVFKWAEIRSFTVGRFLVVVPAVGDPVMVRAIQTNMAQWLKGEPSHSETIAERLNAQLHKRVPTASSDPLAHAPDARQPEAISTKRNMARRVILTAIAWGIIGLTLAIMMDK